MDDAAPAGDDAAMLAPCLLATFMLSALAQDPPPPAAADPAPAIVLLTKEPRALDAAAVRARYAEVVHEDVADGPRVKGAWLRADGADLLGGRAGIAWRVAVVASKYEASPAAASALSATKRARLDEHRSQVVVSAPAGDVATAYRALADVAAALLGPEVVGVVAALHGRPVLGDAAELRDRLLEPDALAALAPDVQTSLVVFLAQTRTLDRDAIGKAVGAEFGVEMATRGKGAKDNFVVVKDTLAVVRRGGETAFVSVDAKIEKIDGPTDPAVKKALAAHAAVLRFVTAGRAGQTAEASRRRFVARLAAALWADDCVALNWHCDRRIVVGGPLVPRMLRADDPVAVSLGDADLPVIVAEDRGAMDKAIVEARATWNRAESFFRGGGELSAKFPFTVPAGGHEHIWITVTGIDGERVTGRIANDPVRVPDLKINQAVECRLAELSDWLYVRDGKMVGGYTVKVLDEQERRRRAAK